MMAEERRTTVWVGVSATIVLFLVGLTLAAAYWGGQIWSGQGRLSVLEIDLAERNKKLPAEETARRLDRVEAAVAGLPGADQAARITAEGLRLKLDAVAERQHEDTRDGRLLYGEMKALTARMESAEARIRQHEDHDFVTHTKPP